MNTEFKDQPGELNQAVVPAKRSMLIWILPIGCLGILLCCGGGFGLLGYWGYNVFYDNPAYKSALNTIQESAQVQELIGSPVILTGLTPMESEANAGEAGWIKYAPSFSGPNGSATADILVVVDNATEEFAIESIIVTINGEAIDLTDEGDFSLNIDDSGNSGE
jgi:hypothetical protein